MRYMTKARPESVMDQIFDSMFYDTPQENQQFSSFAVDITEEENQYVFTAELPGFSDKNVDITVNDNLLVISAPSAGSGTDKSGTDKSGTEDVKEYKYLLRERVERKYKRTFSLPKDSDRDAISASLKDGMLNLTIGKKPEAKPVSIKIN